MISIGTRIKELRELNGFSQGQLALMMGMSRPTLTQIETDKRNIKAQELVKFSELLNTTVDFLVSGKKQRDISIDPEIREKFTHLILYILNKVGAKHNLGKVVLYKLLYFAEFDFYEQYHEYLSGYPFLKLPMGPAPRYFDQLIEDMKDSQQIVSFVTEYGNYVQQRFVPNVPVQDDRFTPEQKKCIEEVLERYSDMGANEISELSHEDKPRQIAGDMDIINYDLVKFREYPYSPVAREKIKNEAHTEMKVSGVFDDLADEPDLYNEY